MSPSQGVVNRAEPGGNQNLTAPGLYLDSPGPLSAPFNYPSYAHFPPPFAPSNPTKLPILNMVYPPPPPPPSLSPERRPPGLDLNNRPQIHSWPSNDFPSTYESSGGYWNQKRPSATDHGHGHGTKRRPSDAEEEEEAGLALAGLSVGLTAKEMKARRDSASVGKSAKKPKKEPATKPAKADVKDGKKSCSECRRLKAKCDRVFPCSNCRRRGCALVCPDGDLSCMQGKRLVLASTEQLHERIAQLESALTHSHARISESTHPLLLPQHLDGGFVTASPPPPLDSPKHSPPPLSRRQTNEDQSPADRGSDASYTIKTPQLGSDRGNSQSRMAVQSLLSSDTAASEGKRELEWVGVNAAPAHLMGHEAQNSVEDHDEHQALVQRLQKLLLVLPPREETQRRADHFWTHSKWYQTILAKEEFDRVYEPAVYAPTAVNPLSPHKLACVLIVLTLDTYFDLTEEEDNPAVGRYWEGVQRCFDTRFGWSASCAGVQALGLAAMFVAFGWRGAKASNFYWLRQMSSAVQQLGLHKDPHPSLPESERNFRRRVFHEAYTIDCLMSINHGQRTGIDISSAETRVATDASRLQTMKYTYMSLVKGSVIDIGCRPFDSPAPWEDVEKVGNIIKQYDARTRAEIHCPLLRGEPLPPAAEDPSKMNIPSLINTTLSMCHYKAMLFLYRPTLRRLIERLRSTQNTDVIVFDERDKETVSMTFGACHAIIACSRYLIRTHPRLSARFWSVWVQALSAAVSLAALAIWCGPHLEQGFVAAAHAELTSAVEAVKEGASKRSRGVLSLFPVIQTTVQQRYPQLVGGDAASAAVCQKNEDMLFALLGGTVTQQGVSPTQGPLMNPPMLETPNTQPPVAGLDTSPTRAAPYPTNQAPPSTFVPPRGGYEHPSGTHYPPPYTAGEPQMILPFVGNQPTVPFEQELPSGTFQSSANLPEEFGVPNGYAPQEGPRGDPSHPMANSQNAVMEDLSRLDASELWARLQTFYEPSPAYWGQSVGNGEYMYHHQVSPDGQAGIV